MDERMRARERAAHDDPAAQRAADAEACRAEGHRERLVQGRLILARPVPGPPITGGGNQGWFVSGIAPIVELHSCICDRCGVDLPPVREAAIRDRLERIREGAIELLAERVASGAGTGPERVGLIEDLRRAVRAARDVVGERKPDGTFWLLLPVDCSQGHESPGFVHWRMETLPGGSIASTSYTVCALCGEVDERPWPR